jgi:uncharacterized protein
MRRKEKEIISKSEIEKIIRISQVCRVAFNTKDYPYIVPLSFGYFESAIYFHTAKKGKKIDCINSDDRVCFEFENNIQLLTNSDKACNWSFLYQSVIGYGHVQEVLDVEEKEKALNHIMEQYSGKRWEIKAESVKTTRLWKISIKSMTGKRSF